MRYILDTNVWVEAARGNIACRDLVDKSGITVVLAPPVVIELIRGLIRGGGQYFSRDRALFQCMMNSDLEILELPKAHVLRALWNISGGKTGILPEHYRRLIESLVRSRTFDDFISETERPESLWKKMNQIDAIHEGVLEKELSALETLAEKASVNAIPRNTSRMYSVGGLLPDPDLLCVKFSAGIEFIKSSMIRIRNGANPRRNDRGLYIDTQLFWYLSDPESVLVTNEDFSAEIRTSPQASRIISYESFSRL
jgi:hypothetical protein